MKLEQTADKFKQVRCPGVARALIQYATSPETQDMSHVDFVDTLVDVELADRDANRYKRLKRAANLKFDVFPEDIKVTAERGLDRQVMANLKQGDWLTKGQNLIITGATGTGKTYLGCAFANLAIKMNMPTYYIRQSRMHEEFEIAYGDGTSVKLRKKYQGRKLLMIDDWGLAIMTERSRQEFFEVIDDRVGVASTIITSQLPVKAWHTYLGEATIADAILDRLIHSSHHIELDGDTMRGQVVGKEVLV